jgi:hypothetical protein
LRRVNWSVACYTSRLKDKIWKFVLDCPYVIIR